MNKLIFLIPIVAYGSTCTELNLQVKQKFAEMTEAINIVDQDRARIKDLHYEFLDQCSYDDISAKCNNLAQEKSKLKQKYFNDFMKLDDITKEYNQLNLILKNCK
jgi:hypothetical protein